MRIFTYLLMLLIVLVGITFACLNAETVPINYYIGHADMPLSLLLAYTLVAGSLLGILIGLKWTLRLKRENYRLGRRLQMSEKEVVNLRAIPFKDEH